VFFHSRTAVKMPSAVSSASFPDVLRVSLTSGLSQRRKGLQASSSLIREGTVGSSFARLLSHALKNTLYALFLGYSRRAKRRLSSVYSCAQKIKVSGGRPRSFFSDPRIWEGVPSNTRPQPPTNKVSPQKSARSAGL